MCTDWDDCVCTSLPENKSLKSIITGTRIDLNIVQFQQSTYTSPSVTQLALTHLTQESQEGKRIRYLFY